MITSKLSGNWGGLGSGSGSLMRRLDMERLCDFARKDIQARSGRGLGSDDAPMKPLKASRIQTTVQGNHVSFQRIGYAAAKVKKGLQGFRDLVGTSAQGGHMWDGCKTTLASETLGRFSFTKKHAREKALANEKRSPFFSFSPSNIRNITAEASRLFGINVRSLGVTQAIAILRRRRAA